MPVVPRCQLENGRIFVSAMSGSARRSCSQLVLFDDLPVVLVHAAMQSEASFELRSCLRRSVRTPILSSGSIRASRFVRNLFLRLRSLEVPCFVLWKFCTPRAFSDRGSSSKFTPNCADEIDVTTRPHENRLSHQPL